MSDTKIEWADKVWNTIRGCETVDEGCANCYAADIAYRFSGHGLPFEGLAKKLTNGKPAWTGKIKVIPKKLLEPLHWRKGRRIFVNSVSDLWWDKVPDSLIMAHMAIAYLTPQHRYLCLTKRADRLVGWLRRIEREAVFRTNDSSDKILFNCAEMLVMHLTGKHSADGVTWDNSIVEKVFEALKKSPNHTQWPPPNWLQGVSVSSQKTAGRIIPLLQAGFNMPWVSAEPLVEELDLTAIQVPDCKVFMDELDGFIGTYDCLSSRLYAYGHLRRGRKLDLPPLEYIIVGGESGKHARICKAQWILKLRGDAKWVKELENARSSGRRNSIKTPFFVKQLGARYYDEIHRAAGAKLGFLEELNGHKNILTDKKGAEPSEWPTRMNIRQFPDKAIPDKAGPTYPRDWPRV